MAVHLLAAERKLYPETYEASLQLLAESRLVSASLYEDLKGLGGLRNILVHGYLRIDPEQLRQSLEKMLCVLPRFAAEIQLHLHA